MTRETIPSNHVVALVKDVATGSEIADELSAAGFERAIVVGDPRVGERLEAESGPVARVLQRLSNHLSEETRYLDQYEEAVRNGQTVIAVKASGDDEVQRANAVLQKRGAWDIRHFGRLVISDLTPDRNPSAGFGRASGPSTPRARLNRVS
ncbi:MAG TPA: hypothetical protein VFS30_15785 [Dehalococcoidia bacterium]|nr:hypothetical protein [Dehalococcoidia bacterium]